MNENGYYLKGNAIELIERRGKQPKRTVTLFGFSSDNDVKRYNFISR